MAACKQVKILIAVEASYIAGLIDGEGTITLSRKHRNENRQLVISISNTEDKLLNYVRNSICISARLTASSLITFLIPGKSGLTLSQRIPVMCAYRL